ncbi:MAG: hypothetical protein JRG73_13095 [Deltaproteobacteria bacterium]|nr:hypothetical protein [Deltaproteobacteria bacterium]
MTQKLPEFLAVGHVTLDQLDTGITPGGSALYAAITASRLRMPAGILTSMGDDFPRMQVFSGFQYRYTKSPHTTSFINRYAGRRSQQIRAVADHIGGDSIPAEWTHIPVVYFCPVAGEIGAELIHRLQPTLAGAGLQGWLRTWDEEGSVWPARWKNGPSLLRHFHMVIMSEEDVAGMEDIVDECRRVVPMVFLTRGARGSILFLKGQRYHIPAYSALDIDPTGAGDVFGAAFMVAYYRSRNWNKAAIIASCAASLAVEARGITGIPTAKAVSARLRQFGCRHPIEV